MTFVLRPDQHRVMDAGSAHFRAGRHRVLIQRLPVSERPVLTACICARRVNVASALNSLCTNELLAQASCAFTANAPAVCLLRRVPSPSGAGLVIDPGRILECLSHRPVGDSAQVGRAGAPRALRCYGLRTFSPRACETLVLSNVELLCEGFDISAIEAVLMLRSTKAWDFFFRWPGARCARPLESVRP